MSRSAPVLLSSRRLQLPGKIHGVESMFAIYTATDVPLISYSYLQHHPILRAQNIHAAPRSALNLRSANGSPTEILGFISLDIMIGEITSTVDCFVPPRLGADVILLYNTIRALLDLYSQTFPFKDSSCISSATLRSYPTPTCYRTALVDDANLIEVYVQCMQIHMCPQDLRR